jgi:DNA-directed RNA polymerase specialized sigma24 family protein
MLNPFKQPGFSYFKKIDTTQQIQVDHSINRYTLLIGRFYKLLHRYACIRLGNEHWADEAVSRAFMKIWKHPHLLNDHAAAKIFLLRQTKLECMSILHQEVMKWLRGKKLIAG